MATSAPDRRTWALTGYHPLSGIPICLPHPEPTTLEAAAAVCNAIATTYSVTDLVLHPSDLAKEVTVLVLYSFGGRDHIAELPADSVDDAVIRMASLASSGTLTVLA